MFPNPIFWSKELCPNVRSEETHRAALAAPPRAAADDPAHAGPRWARCREGGVVLITPAAAPQSVASSLDIGVTLLLQQIPGTRVVSAGYRPDHRHQ